MSKRELSPKFLKRQAELRAVRTKTPSTFYWFHHPDLQGLKVCPSGKSLEEATKHDVYKYHIPAEELYGKE